MIDYSEGITALSNKCKQLYDAVLHHRFSEARILCAEISTEARLINQQIVIQHPEETGHSNVVKMPILNVWNQNDSA